MAEKKAEPSQETTPENGASMEAAIGEDTPQPGGDEATAPAISEKTISPEQFAQFQSELQEALARADEYLDGWQRARAEFTNYKKRVEREQALAHQTAAGNILKRYLDISDDLERALRNRPQGEEGAAWAEGIDLIYRKLVSTIESEGVKKIDTEGQFFDPMLHEAISQEDSDHHESGQIIEVVQPGFMLGERVLRPARVRVAR